MTITNTITRTKMKTTHTNRKWADTYINQEVIWMNEEQKEHYYTSLDFEINE